MNMSIVKGRKKIIFFSILVILPYLFLVLLEIILRLFSVGHDLGLFCSSSNPRYYEINRNIGERYFSRFEHTAPLSDTFLKQKPTDGYRIFVMGESTVQGFPYDANIAFSRILRRRLQDIYTNRYIEVVNLGLTAVNSYTLLDFTDEILQQQPDIVLIYAGHNEFYGALGVASMENGSIPQWLKKLHLKAVHLRIYQLLQKGVGSINRLLHPKTEEEAKATLMEQIVGKNVTPYNSKMYSEGLAQFHDNMGKLLAKFKEAHVPVIISDLVSNIRDLPPFRSLNYEMYPRADSLYHNAKRLDAGHFFDRAKEEYLRAKDFDAIRFRAPEDINRIISTLSDSLGLFYISLKSLFEHFSSNGIVGDNLMTDHLHPNVDGYFLMAEGFLNAMREHELIDNNRDSLRVLPWTYYRNNWGFTEFDSMIADIRIRHLKAGWPYQPESTVNAFRSTYTPHGTIDSLAFVSVIYKNKNSITGHEILATYYQSLGDFKKASKEYLSIAYILPMDISSYYYAADLAFKADDYEAAIRYLRESPGSDTSSYAQFMLATIYFSQKDPRKALSCIDHFQSINENNATDLKFQKLKYKIQKGSGMSNDAQQTLTEIQIYDPSFTGSNVGKNIAIIIPASIKPYLDKADALRRSGQVSEAVAVLKEANKIKEIPYTNLLIGKLLYSQKKPEALSYLEKANREIKEDPSLYFSLCVLYIMKRDFSKAKPALDNFTRLQGERHPLSIQLKELFNKSIARGNH
jgi:tetratricopeptide (TPR) repeat protein